MARKKTSKSSEKSNTLKWLRHMIHQRKYTKEENQKKMACIEAWGEETWPAHQQKKIKLSWLKELIHLIDILWFDDQLMHTLKAAYRHVTIKVSNRQDMSVAAYVLQRHRDQDLLILLHDRVFLQLDFDSYDEKHQSSKSHDDHHTADKCECHLNGSKFQTGGKLCSNRIQCMTQILCHELVHALLTVYRRLLNQPLPDDPHHEQFQQVVWRLFQHDDSQHGLMRGLKHKHELRETKQALETDPSQPVCFLYQNQFLIGQVKRMLPDNLVELESHRGDTYEVHLGLLAPLH